MAGNILLSVGCIISHKKDCQKMCDHRKTSKYQKRGSFGGPENLAICRKLYFHKKDCHKMCDHAEKSLRPSIKGFLLKKFPCKMLPGLFICLSISLDGFIGPGGHPEQHGGLESGGNG